MPSFLDVGYSAQEVVMEYDWFPSRRDDDIKYASRENKPAAPLEALGAQPSQAALVGSSVPQPSPPPDAPTQLVNEVGEPPHGSCYTFFFTGSCDRPGCPYRHTSADRTSNTRPILEENLQRSQPRGGSYNQQQSTNRDAYLAGNSRGSSPYRHTSTRYNNHNDDPEQFGADFTYRPRGFQPQRPCFSYQRGYCKFGNECAFSHDMETASKPTRYQ